MPAGRPSKYKPEYCEQAIDLGKRGKSQVQIACEFEVDPKSLRDWAEAHPEFSLALTRAKAHEQAWWENAAQSGDVGDKINPMAWKVSMAARFKEDYTERKQVDAKTTIVMESDSDKL